MSSSAAPSSRAASSRAAAPTAAAAPFVAHEFYDFIDPGTGRVDLSRITPVTCGFTHAATGKPAVFAEPYYPTFFQEALARKLLHKPDKHLDIPVSPGSTDTYLSVFYQSTQHVLDAYLTRHAPAPNTVLSHMVCDNAPTSLAGRWRQAAHERSLGMSDCHNVNLTSMVKPYRNTVQKRCGYINVDAKSAHPSLLHFLQKAAGNYPQEDVNHFAHFLEHKNSIYAECVAALTPNRPLKPGHRGFEKNDAKRVLIAACYGGDHHALLKAMTEGKRDKHVYNPTTKKWAKKSVEQVPVDIDLPNRKNGYTGKRGIEWFERMSRIIGAILDRIWKANEDQAFKIVEHAKQVSNSTRKKRGYEGEHAVATDADITIQTQRAMASSVLLSLEHRCVSKLFYGGLVQAGMVEADTLQWEWDGCSVRPLGTHNRDTLLAYLNQHVELTGLTFDEKEYECVLDGPWVDAHFAHAWRPGPVEPLVPKLRELVVAHEATLISNLMRSPLDYIQYPGRARKASVKTVIEHFCSLFHYVVGEKRYYYISPHDNSWDCLEESQVSEMCSILTIDVNTDPETGKETLDWHWSADNRAALRFIQAVQASNMRMQYMSANANPTVSADTCKAMACLNTWRDHEWRAACDAMKRGETVPYTHDARAIEMAMHVMWTMFHTEDDLLVVNGFAQTEEEAYAHFMSNPRQCCHLRHSPLATIIQIFALLVQKPGQRPNVGLVLTSQPGAGKNVILKLLALCLGMHNQYVTAAIKDAFEHTAPLCGKQLIVFNEADERVFRPYVGRLKTMVTDQKVDRMQKFQVTTERDNIGFYVIVSNDTCPIDLGAEDRRWMVLDVPTEANKLWRTYDAIQGASVSHYGQRPTEIEKTPFLREWLTKFEVTETTGHPDSVFSVYTWLDGIELDHEKITPKATDAKQRLTAPSDEEVLAHLWLHQQFTAQPNCLKLMLTNDTLSQLAQRFYGHTSNRPPPKLTKLVGTVWHHLTASYGPKKFHRLPSMTTSTPYLPAVDTREKMYTRWCRETLDARLAEIQPPSSNGVCLL